MGRTQRNRPALADTPAFFYGVLGLFLTATVVVIVYKTTQILG